MAQPLLSSYPHLHSILRADPRANQEFQAALSQVRNPVGAQVTELNASVDAERKLRQECQVELQRCQHNLAKIIRFVRLLGDVIEPQTQLTPYSIDVSEKKHYEIRFSADQIRLLLKHYWDSIGSEVEQLLARHLDPAEARKEDS